MSERLLSVLPSKAIDPKRTGLSKSTVLAASYCQRKAFYSETVRDANGARIQYAMPERVIFGVAVDTAALALMTWYREGWLPEQGTSERAALVERATTLGFEAAAERECSDTIDWGAFHNELALSTFELGRLLDTGAVPLVGASFQGLHGESLRYVDPVHGELIGTPDVITYDTDGSLFVIDVKAAARAKSESDLFSAEMAYYTMLVRKALAMPAMEYPRVGYLVWVRSKSAPRWSFIHGKTGPAHEVLAEEYVTTTLRAVRGEAVGFSTQMCRTCDWARPVEGAFEGCAVGRAVLSVGGATE
jgi:hypothetical protein